MKFENKFERKTKALWDVIENSPNLKDMIYNLAPKRSFFTRNQELESRDSRGTHVNHRGYRGTNEINGQFSPLECVAARTTWDSDSVIEGLGKLNETWPFKTKLMRVTDTASLIYFVVIIFLCMLACALGYSVRVNFFDL